MRQHLFGFNLSYRKPTYKIWALNSRSFGNSAINKATKVASRQWTRLSVWPWLPHKRSGPKLLWKDPESSQSFQKVVICYHPATALSIIPSGKIHQKLHPYQSLHTTAYLSVPFLSPHHTQKCSLRSPRSIPLKEFRQDSFTDTLPKRLFHRFISGCFPSRYKIPQNTE